MIELVDPKRLQGKKSQIMNIICLHFSCNNLCIFDLKRLKIWPKIFCCAIKYQSIGIINVYPREIVKLVFIFHLIYLS